MDSVEKSINSGHEGDLPTRKTLKEGFTPKVIPKCGAGRERVTPGYGLAV